MSKSSYLFCLLHTLNKGIVRKKCQDIFVMEALLSKFYHPALKCPILSITFCISEKS